MDLDHHRLRHTGSMFRSFSIWLAAPFYLLAQSVGLSALAVESFPVVFNRDIRPILSDRCFSCHGPDDKKREADLRFDLEEEAKKDLGGYHAIVPEKPHESVLIDRITASHTAERMPPEAVDDALSSAEIELLRRWIAEGAVYEKHWSFQVISPQALPSVAASNWSRNAIDRFVLANLERRGVVPSPVADRATLIRRLSLDLTGLPPMPQAVTRFIDDTSPNAYEKVVDRILASQHYGERMARHWLDLARYADTNGYANDRLRSVWPFRDWVIQAFNEDMPFDQFTIEQLAGDLLSAPTESQLVATGFHRNTPYQTEGGSDPEQYRVERTKNRTDTTGAVWLGLTVGCAQCHTHKYDPITQQEYYQLYAFFNGSDEPTHTLKGTAKQLSAIKKLESKLAKLESQVAQEQALRDSPLAPEWKWLEFEAMASQAGATLESLEDGSILASGVNASADTYVFKTTLKSPATVVRIETLTHESLPHHGPGRAENGNFILAELTIESQGKQMAIVSGTADHAQQNYPVADAFDSDVETGWAINVPAGSMNVNRTAIFALAETVQGDLCIKIKQGMNGHSLGRFRIATSPQMSLFDSANKLAALSEKKQHLQAELKRLKSSRPTTLVVRERSETRETFVQIRGDFLDRGALVKPATFQVLQPLPTAAGHLPTRLDLARWLVAADNPLTPRVQANRMWQYMFGIGLVETENDFGYQGSLPTHPQLLDYLAWELLRGQWSWKRGFRHIATSATYRQSSHFREDLFALDSMNHWLGRQNRFRVEGEIVRDLGLATSGLLSRKLGGPAVFPPIPPNVIGTSSANHKWPESNGEDRYRRGIYTAIYRANVYPMLLMFDGPDRDNACTRRSRSNTPMQALTIANDTTFLEMARALGSRLHKCQGQNSQDVIRFGFLVGLSREATSREVRTLSAFQASRREYYESHTEETLALTNATDPELASWIAVARVIMNLDEFITRE